MLEDLQARLALLTARPTVLDEYMSYLMMHTKQVRALHTKQHTAASVHKAARSR